MSTSSKSTPRLVAFGSQLGLTIGACLAIRSGKVPLGVPGEWEWLRVKLPVDSWGLLFGCLAILGYSCFVALGFRSLDRGAGRASRFFWLSGLLGAATVVQILAQEAAPTAHGLAKWAIALPNPGSNGYFTVAKAREGNFDRFLAEYPEWIKTQGSLHIGTHPPGLFVAAWASLKAAESSPGLARLVMGLMPETVDRAFRISAESYGLTREDRASLAITGALTLFFCAATVIPLYLLARRTMPPPHAWACAACWPLVPAALMFQPTADTAFPSLTAWALVLAAWSARRAVWAVACGAVLGIGMQLSLVFLAAGAIVAVTILGDRESTWRSRWIRFFATGAGFLATTFAFRAAYSANPFLIWWANQRNHAGFYIEFPRTYHAWLAETPIEVAVAVGMPAVVWIALGARTAPREFLATAAVLAVLLISGRSLSEVARLWIPFFPMLLLAVGPGMRRSEAKPFALGWTTALLGAQTVWLQTMIQVVYPV